MAPSSAIDPGPEPIVTGYRRLSGGNWEVTYSLAPARRVRKTVPAEEFNPATIRQLGRQLADKPAYRKGTVG